MRFLTTRAATRALAGLELAIRSLAILLSLTIGSFAIVAGMCGFGTGAFGPGASAFALSESAFAPSASGFDLSTSAFGKDKPLSWKPIEDALLRVNDSPP
jgi:hypothetical protein